jgi:DNA-binding transcriptional LysR family regulator
MINEPDLRQLRTFVVVAEELHFTRAAERLNLGQQGLSAQVRRLEERLGVTLFRRSTRRVELTDAGQVLLEHARPLLTTADHAWEQVRLAGSGEVGALSICYSPTARNDVLPEVLAEVRQRHPLLEVRSAEDWGGRDAIVRGLADVAFVRLSVPDEAPISNALVKESQIGLLVGVTHPCAGQATIGFDEVGSDTLEVPARRHSPRFHDNLMELLRGHHFHGEIREYHNLTSRFMLDDEEACDRIVSGATFGFGFEDQYPDLPAGMVWIPLEPALYAPMYVCWRDEVTPAMVNFVTVVLDVSERLGWVRPQTRAQTPRPPVGPEPTLSGPR